LRKTVEKLNFKKLNDQLLDYVGSDPLKRVASCGIRGEIFFPVPCILEVNPFLLGYYRLLYGFSQKEFFNKGPYGRYKILEDRGEIPNKLHSSIPSLCRSLIQSGQLLVEGLDQISLSIVHELQLLTIGPQLRGSQNTKLGQEATKEVFELIKKILKPYLRETTERTIRIENDSGRTVLVEFFSDPDIRITEKLESHVRPLVSIEIKGGTDGSNIHNRLGEAEKSHQKAKNRGFFEFWTIIRVDVNPQTAKWESPTTSRFFHLDRINDFKSSEHRQFCDMIDSLMGISTSALK